MNQHQLPDTEILLHHIALICNFFGQTLAHAVQPQHFVLSDICIIFYLSYFRAVSKVFNWSLLLIFQFFFNSVVIDVLFDIHNVSAVSSLTKPQ